MNLVLRARARNDLHRILAYYEWHGNSPSVGSRFLASFHQTCLLLVQYPHIGQFEQPPAASRYAEANIRRFVVRRFHNYFIYYKVEKASLVITRVLHAARDPKLRTADPS